MLLKEIKVKNFKVFRELELCLDGRNTVLFGVNGTGKSTVLAAINYIFRVFLNQINPAQSKAYERFQDDMLNTMADRLELSAVVQLKDNYLLSRSYSRKKKNTRNAEATYPKVNYAIFKEAFRELYIDSDAVGMPIFVHYSTNRAVLDVPSRIKTEHEFDKLSAIAHAIDLQLDFRAFFEWFREREADEVLRIRENEKYVDPALKCVRKAIEAMIGNVSGLQVKRGPVRMVVEKAGREIRVDMLSDGEKCTLALFGDLARRLAIANPYAVNPLEGEGIVLIDEMELHMHPSWQRRVLAVLQEVFPNVQFIITTHSPQILGELGEKWNIFSLGLDIHGNGIVTSQPSRLNGYDSNMILEEYMGTASESKEKREAVRSVNEAIRKSQKES